MTCGGGRSWTATHLDDGNQPPPAAVVPELSPADLRSELARLIEDGTTAGWEAISELEGHVQRAVVSAHTYVSSDVGSRRLLDESDLLRVRDELLLGEVGAAGSPVMHLIEKSLDPLAFARVDPQRYLAVAINREAQRAIRQAVGDPITGSKIRRVARDLGVGPFQMPPDDNLQFGALPQPAQDAVKRILAVYREQYPVDKMGWRRVVNALSVVPDAMSSTVPLAEIPGRLA